MTIKYTTVRLQRKEALLGYTEPYLLEVMMFQNGSWHRISVSVMYIAREIVNFI